MKRNNVKFFVWLLWLRNNKSSKIDVVYDLGYGLLKSTVPKKSIELFLYFE